jgi:sialate O-acetylesterase
VELMNGFLRTGLTLAVLGSPCVHADVQLASIFTNNMVFQRNARIQVWGTAADGEHIEVSLAGNRTETIAHDGEWRTALPARQAGGPFNLVVRSTNTVTIRNLLIGDVWLCSGQSNMAYPLSNTTTPVQTVSAEISQNIRLYTVSSGLPPRPSELRPRQWQPATQWSASRFSGLCYLFGAELYQELRVPIGLIVSAVGATPIEAWLADDGVPEPATSAGVKAMAERSQLFRSMILPFTSHAIRGVAWYQGERNRINASSYEALLKQMVAGWRAAWSNDKLPFLIVQLSSFGKQAAFQERSLWAEVRDAQRRAVEALPQAALVVSADVGNGEVHPPDKYSVARRLADAALTLAYAASGKYRMPTVTGVARTEGGLSVAFSAQQDCIRATESMDDTFYVRDQTGRWNRAIAALEQTTVRLVSPGVAKPTMLRYGWSDNPRLGVFDCNGAPASPFEIAIP